MIKKIIEKKKGKKKNKEGRSSGLIWEEGVCFVKMREGRNI